MKMGIHRIKVPEEHLDIIEDLADDEGTSLLIKSLRGDLKRRHDKFWEAIRQAIPELKDIDEDLHYLRDKKEVYWIDSR